MNRFFVALWLQGRDMSQKDSVCSKNTNSLSVELQFELSLYCSLFLTLFVLINAIQMILPFTDRYGVPKRAY